jgi:hypothetical protein
MCTPHTASSLEQVVMGGETAGKKAGGERGKEKEYCTCVFQCGNGVWRKSEKGEGEWVWEKACRKYCHAGVCDSQGA